MKTCPVCDKDYTDQHSSCPTDGAVLIESRELGPGSLVRGKYRIVRKLGQGGMGVVYLAEDALLGVCVALKFLAGDLGKDPRFIKRFRTEARAAYQLRHPNIVEVTNLDQGEDGTLFIAMEYVDGPGLRTVLEENRGGLAIPRALHIAQGIASGLVAAHAQGSVHRDIKPENILLAVAADGTERPKILDFGIVAVTESVTRQSLTRGLLLTPEYAAPEQWLEMPSAEIDGRTDLYALGCVLYEMLTGRPPFHAHNTAGWMKMHLETPPHPPSELRPEVASWKALDALVLRLLAKERDQRPANALEALADLAGVVEMPPERPTPAPQVSKRMETILERSLPSPPARGETILDPMAHFTPAQPENHATPHRGELETPESAVSGEDDSASELDTTETKVQPAPKLGKWYIAGWILLVIRLIVHGIVYLIVPFLDIPVEGLGKNLQHLDTYFVMFAGVALIVSALAIAIRQTTRAAGAVLCAIVLSLVVLSQSLFILFFLRYGFPHDDYLVIPRAFQNLGFLGVALMIVAMERKGRGKPGRLFTYGRLLFAVAMVAYILARIWLSIAFIQRWHENLLGTIVWGSWPAYFVGAALAIAAVGMLFRRTAWSAALCFGGAAILNLPLLYLYRFDDFTGRNDYLLPGIILWLFEFSLAGGALVMTAGLQETQEHGNHARDTVSLLSNRLRNAFRQRRVRITALFAGLAVTSILGLHGIVPYIFYHASLENDSGFLDIAGSLYKIFGVTPLRTAGEIDLQVQHAHACSAGNANDCLSLGDHYVETDRDGRPGSRADHLYKRAMDLYSARCENGDAGGCYAVGVLYRESEGVALDNSKAAEYFTRSCNAGDDFGCIALADAYRQGNGVDRNLAKAEALITKACKSTPANECAGIYDSLGDDYFKGNGGAPDYNRASANYKKSCDLGSSTGCTDLFNIAYAFDIGTDVAKNQAKADLLYASACDGGMLTACNNLGVNYESGQGVGQDNPKAAALLKKACDAGFEESCGYLGDLYWSGTGVGQDKAKGKALMQRACSAGNQWSCDRLKEIAKEP